MAISLRPISFHCARTICDSVATALGVSFFCVTSCGRLRAPVAPGGAPGGAPAAAPAGAKAASRADSAAPSTIRESKILRFIADLPGRPGRQQWRTLHRLDRRRSASPAGEGERSAPCPPQPPDHILRRNGGRRHAKSGKGMRDKLTSSDSEASAKVNWGFFIMRTVIALSVLGLL